MNWYIQLVAQETPQEPPQGTQPNAGNTGNLGNPGNLGNEGNEGTLVLQSFWPGAVYANHHPVVGERGTWYVGESAYPCTVTSSQPWPNNPVFGNVNFETDTPHPTGGNTFKMRYRTNVPNNSNG